MPASHRNSDLRECDATTIVSGQSTVFVNGKLWAVEGDKNSHGDGDLVSSLASDIFISGKKVIVVGDQAIADDLCPILGEPHCMPGASQGSGDVFAS